MRYELIETSSTSCLKALIHDLTNAGWRLVGSPFVFGGKLCRLFEIAEPAPVSEAAPVAVPNIETLRDEFTALARLNFLDTTRTNNDVRPPWRYPRDDYRSPITTLYWAHFLRAAGVKDV